MSKRILLTAITICFGINVYAGGHGNNCNPNASVQVYNQCSDNLGLLITLTNFTNSSTCCASLEPNSIAQGGYATYHINDGCSYYISGAGKEVNQYQLHNGNVVILKGNFLFLKCKVSSID